MPTPMCEYGIVAQRIGRSLDPPIEVDPNDEFDVSRFYEIIVPTLPDEMRQAILDELLSKEH